VIFPIKRVTGCSKKFLLKLKGRGIVASSPESYCVDRGSCDNGACLMSLTVFIFRRSLLFYHGIFQTGNLKVIFLHIAVKRFTRSLHENQQDFMVLIQTFVSTFQCERKQLIVV
jgi:hypothetical protein